MTTVVSPRFTRPERAPAATGGVIERLGRRLIARDESFFDLLESQADAAARAARVFHALAQDFAGADAQAERIAAIETEADAITHALANRIDRAFVTPFDKEDLAALTVRLDDVTDAIEETAARVALYRLPAPPRPDLAPLAALVVSAADTLTEAVAFLRRSQGRERVSGVLAGIHALRGECDARCLACLADLLDGESGDPVAVIKWKDIYDGLQTAADACAHAALLVESIVVKYA